MIYLFVLFLYLQTTFYVQVQDHSFSNNFREDQWVIKSITVSN